MYLGIQLETLKIKNKKVAYLKVLDGLKRIKVITLLSTFSWQHQKFTALVVGL